MIWAGTPSAGSSPAAPRPRPDPAKEEAWASAGDAASAEAASPSRRDVQCTAALIARRKRLMQLELESEAQDAHARGYLQELEDEVREEWDQVRMLRQLLARTSSTARAVDAARLVEENCAQAAARARLELGAKWLLRCVPLRAGQRRRGSMSGLRRCRHCGASWPQKHSTGSEAASAAATAGM
mmetsp:Transcript_79372/g.224689  ORF Transcript_79372/g.224689 Transcript_79372/m.224689 type:complete len:184 (-) Transcript_79372:254-805(-)